MEEKHYDSTHGEHGNVGAHVQRGRTSTFATELDYPLKYLRSESTGTIYEVNGELKATKLYQYEHYYVE